MEQRWTEFPEAEQLESSASVVVEHSEIVGFPDIALHKREMRAIALFNKTTRNLIGNEFFDPFAGQLFDQRGRGWNHGWSELQLDRIRLSACRFSLAYSQELGPIRDNYGRRFSQ